LSSIVLIFQWVKKKTAAGLASLFGWRERTLSYNARQNRESSVKQKMRALSFFFLLISMNLLASTAQSPSASLVSAIRNNDLTALRSLANSGNVNTPDDRRRTPLMVAAGTGTLDAMQILV